MTTEPPVAVTVAQSHADAAERHLEPHHVTDDTRAITHALLYVGAAIEAATQHRTDDADTLGAMLEDRLTSIADSINPAFIVPPRVPWRARLAALLRPTPAGWHEIDGGDQ
jgi:hypothetical protein